MNFFGDKWTKLPGDDSERIPVPVGKKCQWCEETFTALSCGIIVSELPYHPECQFRFFCGSLGHHAGLCSCTRRERYGLGFLSSIEFEDPRNLTKREAARAALMFAQAKDNKAKGKVLIEWLAKAVEREP